MRHIPISDGMVLADFAKPHKYIIQEKADTPITKLHLLQLIREGNVVEALIASNKLGWTNDVRYYIRSRITGSRDKKLLVGAITALVERGEYGIAMNAMKSLAIYPEYSDIMSDLATAYADTSAAAIEFAGPIAT
jgi:hypothetical protein